MFSLKVLFKSPSWNTCRANAYYSGLKTTMKKVHFYIVFGVIITFKIIFQLIFFFYNNYVLYIFYNIFYNTFNENTWIKFKHIILKNTLFEYVIITFEKSIQMPTFIYNGILNKNFNLHFNHTTCDKVPLYK
jgi:hypothetical protein